MIMLALGGGTSSLAKTMTAGLYCQVLRVTSTLPIWLYPKHFQENYELDAWTRCRKYVALSKKCAWEEGDTDKERTKAPEEKSHLEE